MDQTVRVVLYAVAFALFAVEAVLKRNLIGAGLALVTLVWLVDAA